MTRGLLLRLAKLEARHRDEPILLDFSNGNPPVAIHGTVRHFYRLMKALKSEFLDDPEAERDLQRLRMATSIKGESAQLFGLAQALAKGPIDTPHNHTTGGTTL